MKGHYTFSVVPSATIEILNNALFHCKVLSVEKNALENVINCQNTKIAFY